MEQTKKERAAKNVLIAVLYVCAFLIAIFISFTLSANVGVRITLLVCGLLAGWIISSLFHEAGHAIAAKRNGFEVTGFSLLFFRYDKQAIKKITLSFHSGYLGATDVVPTAKDDVCKRYAKVVLGGILGSVVAAAFLTAGFFAFMAASLPFGAIFFCGMPFSLIVLIINAVPGFVEGNDGSVLKTLTSDGAEKDATEKLLKITAELYDGKSYAEADESLFVVDGEIPNVLKARFALLGLRRAEELFEPEEIVKNLEILQSEEEYLDDDAATEMLFAYILLEDEKKIAEYEYLLDGCDTLPGASGMRTLIYYENYKGDEQYVKASLKSAKKICVKAYLKGDGKFNAEMLSRLN